MSRFESTIRRVRVYRGRMLRAFGGGLRQKCFFLHLPKCGGTSISEAMYATVPIHKKISVIDALATRRASSIIHFGEDSSTLTHEDYENAHLTFALREQMMIADMCHNVQLVHGHMLFSDKAYQHFGQTYKHITLMREPAARAISNFRMNIERGNIGPDIDAWMDDVQGRSHTRMLLRYFSGKATIADDEVGPCLEKALETIEKFELIGFLNRANDFLDRFADIFGPRPKLHRYRVGGGPSLTFSKEQTARLEQLCAPDIEIYEAAKKRFS